MHRFRRKQWFTVVAPTAAMLVSLCGLFHRATAAEKKPPAAPAGMVLVEGGSFMMGDVFGDGKARQPETPVHEVVLDWFYIARHEVTFGQFKEFAEATGYRTSAEKREGAYSQSPFETHWKLLGFKQADNEPVLQMSWNALGLYDMSGNAWEWCTDVLADYPATKRVNPYVPGDEPRILRGGCIGGDAKCARVTSRYCFGRADHCGNSGFRLARTAF